MSLQKFAAILNKIMYITNTFALTVPANCLINH